MQVFTNAEGYCAVTYDPSRLSQNAIWTFIVALLPLFMSSTMLLHLSPRRHTLPQFTTLFRFSAISNILLTCWAMWMHFESRLYPWQEWKLVYFTIVSVWCCVNSTLSYAYLVEQKARSESRVRELNVNGLASTPSAIIMSTPLASAGVQSGGSSGYATVGQVVKVAGGVDEGEKEKVVRSSMTGD
ncbi:hypothetical protein BCR44DRAFT_54295 [Catenaria anguillulae PL171]|uniref:Uncharacterized protein n=1 Tax=Catenaria anguillulae PL171 TaxID=765915 RepID=A0A1Y2HB14_9FUNG|nr:hypothetical protein BCR44DRAFT_54295 [Catenaria anguillulae PL171]